MTPSSQLTAGGEAQPTSALDGSMPSHAKPSLQVGVFRTCEDGPGEGLQLSTVHATASSQLTACPPWQRPATHVSMPLHALPSVQSALVVHGFATQPPCCGTQIWAGGHAALLMVCWHAWVLSVHA